MPDWFAITIYGASDDLVEVAGDAPGCDEYNCEEAMFRLDGGDSQARVWVKYVNPGVWSIAVAPVDEGVPMTPVLVSGGTRVPGTTDSGPSNYTAVAQAKVLAVIYEVES